MKHQSTIRNSSHPVHVQQRHHGLWAWTLVGLLLVSVVAFTNILAAKPLAAMQLSESTSEEDLPATGGTTPASGGIATSGGTTTSGETSGTAGGTTTDETTGTASGATTVSEEPAPSEELVASEETVPSEKKPVVTEDKPVPSEDKPVVTEDKPVPSEDKPAPILKSISG